MNYTNIFSFIYFCICTNSAPVSRIPIQEFAYSTFEQIEVAKKNLVSSYLKTIKLIETRNISLFDKDEIFDASGERKYLENDSHTRLTVQNFSEVGENAFSKFHELIFNRCDALKMLYYDLFFFETKIKAIYEIPSIFNEQSVLEYRFQQYRNLFDQMITTIEALSDELKERMLLLNKYYKFLIAENGCNFELEDLNSFRLEFNTMHQRFTTLIQNSKNIVKLETIITKNVFKFACQLEEFEKNRPPSFEFFYFSKNTNLTRVYTIFLTKTIKEAHSIYEKMRRRLLEREEGSMNELDTPFIEQLMLFSAKYTLILFFSKGLLQSHKGIPHTALNREIAISKRLINGAWTDLLQSSLRKDLKYITEKTNGLFFGNLLGKDTFCPLNFDEMIINEWEMHKVINKD